MSPAIIQEEGRVYSCTVSVHTALLESDTCINTAGLQAGHATAKPKPVFGRLEGDFVTTAPDAPQKALSEVGLKA